MSPLVSEWVDKAEGDFIAAGRELRARKQPVYHVVCFLTQQCAEKYLKALLEQNDKQIPRIHDLVELLELCKEFDPSLEIVRADLEALGRFSVRVRYPGTDVDKEDAKSAFQSAKAVRQIIRQKLGLG
jgi:HEPN domain-containing protein